MFSNIFVTLLICAVFVIFSIYYLYQLYVKDRLIAPNYFKMPHTETYRVDWTMRRAFLLVSEPMAERWFESYSHLRQGFCISFLCAFRLLDVVYIAYETNEQNVTTSATFVLCGCRSKKRLFARAKQLADMRHSSHRDLNTSHLYTFVAGYGTIEGHEY